MSKLIFSIIFSSFALSFSFGQIPQNIYKSDSTKADNFNYIIPSAENGTYGAKEKVAVLFYGLFDSPYSIFFESDLVQFLGNDGYTTIIPVLSKANDGLYLTETSIQKVHNLIQSYLSQKGLQKDTQIVLGGFSIGGTRAIKTYLYNLALKERLNITHVFTIDPPLDFHRFLFAEKSSNNQELKPVVEKELTTQNFDLYIDSISIFNYEKLENLNASLFKNIKFRIYNEPDLEWQFKQKNRSLMDLNLIDQSILIKYIKSKYPESPAELILSKIKGLRKQTNQRNPHSWNIIDTQDLLNWLSL